MKLLWLVMVLILAGCDAGPSPSAGLDLEETHTETEQIRKAVDDYKTHPTREKKALVDLAFADFDQQLEDLKRDAQEQSGNEREATEERIADLKHRRDLHWARCQATPAPMEVRTAGGISVRRAQRVNSE